MHASAEQPLTEANAEGLVTNVERMTKRAPSLDIDALSFVIQFLRGSNPRSFCEHGSRVGRADDADELPMFGYVFTVRSRAQHRFDRFAQDLHHPLDLFFFGDKRRGDKINVAAQSAEHAAL